MPWAENSREVFRHVQRFIERVLESAPPLGTLDLTGTLGLATAAPVLRPPESIARTSVARKDARMGGRMHPRATVAGLLRVACWLR